MELSYTDKFELGKINRFIYKNPPEKVGTSSKDRKPEKESHKAPKKRPYKATPKYGEEEGTIKRENQEKRKTTSEKTKEEIEKSKIDPLSELEKQKIEKLNKALLENAGNYTKNVESAEKSPEKSKELERIRQAAESEAVSLSDLQGGHEWISKDLKFGQKYAKLSQAYLKVTEVNGQKAFEVRKELDRDNKIKFGLGAGHLLPPSITCIEVTGGGVTRKGTRKTPPDSPDGRIGYYDENNEYIAIFGGYKIKPLKFIPETGQKYKAALEREEKIYLDRKAREKESIDGSRYKDPDLVEYMKRNPDIGLSNSPVGTTQSLRTSSRKDLEDFFGKDRKHEVPKVLEAQKDLIRTESILYAFGIHTEVNSEIDGGLHYIALKGKASEMLGWTQETTTQQEALLAKVKDKKYIQEQIKDLEEGKEKTLPEGLIAVKSNKEKDGYYLKTKLSKRIGNFEKWSAEKTAKSLTNKPNETVQLLQKLAGKTRNREIAGYQLIGTYTFDVRHLKVLNRLSKNQEELEGIARKVGEEKQNIHIRDLIQGIFNPEIDQELSKTGMSINQAEEYARRHGLEALLHGNKSMRRILKMSIGKKTFKIDGDYRFNALSRHRDFPYVYQGKLGKLCCAWTVSTYLGLGGRKNEEKIYHGKTGNVSRLLARAVRSNIERSKKLGLPENAGFVIGFENFQKGDLLAFSGRKTDRLAHIGIVRDVLTIDGEKFLAIQHDASDIQVNIVPVKKRSRGATRLRKALRNRTTRKAYIQKYPKLAEIYEYRKDHPGTVKVSANAGNWYGDASKGSGCIMFAVRTAGLVTG